MNFRACGSLLTAFKRESDGKFILVMCSAHSENLWENINIDEARDLNGESELIFNRAFSKACWNLRQVGLIGNL